MKKRVNIVFEEAFQVGLTAYLILLLTETFSEGIVSNFFNINILLGVVFISGVIMVLTQSENVHQKTPVYGNKLSRLDFNLTLLAAAGGAALIFTKTKNMGNISIGISAVAFLLIFLLSYLVLTGESEAS